MPQSIRFVFILSLASLLLIGQSCYTVVPSSQPETRELTLVELEVRNFDLLRFDIDQDLLGMWFQSYVAYDYGTVVDRIQFEPDGSMTYTPHSELQLAKSALAEFRTLSDTLIIRFQDGQYLEKYFFKVKNDVLELVNTREPRNDPIPRIEEIRGKWVREIH